jgi:hypothetical protein
MPSALSAKLLPRRCFFNSRYDRFIAEEQTNRYAQAVRALLTVFACRATTFLTGVV